MVIERMRRLTAEKDLKTTAEVANFHMDRDSLQIQKSLANLITLLNVGSDTKQPCAWTFIVSQRVINRC